MDVELENQRITLTGIPQLNWGNIRGYHSSDIPQFSNLTFITISRRLKFN